jgi:hypothetical protein
MLTTGGSVRRLFCMGRREERAEKHSSPTLFDLSAAAHAPRLSLASHLHREAAGRQIYIAKGRRLCEQYRWRNYLEIEKCDAFLLRWVRNYHQTQS